MEMFVDLYWCSTVNSYKHLRIVGQLCPLGLKTTHEGKKSGRYSANCWWKMVIINFRQLERHYGVIWAQAQAYTIMLHNESQTSSCLIVFLSIWLKYTLTIISGSRSIFFLFLRICIPACKRSKSLVQCSEWGLNGKNGGGGKGI